MSASDAAPLPRLGEVFFDVRGESRSMRLSWYADTAVAVFSIWQGGTCTGTFRLPIADLPRMVEALKRGPRGASGARAPEEPPPAAARRGGPGRGSPRGSPAGPDGERGPGQVETASYGPPVTGEHTPPPGPTSGGYPMEPLGDLPGPPAHGGDRARYREEPPGALPGGRHSTPLPVGAWDYQGDPLAGGYPGEPGVAAGGEELAGPHGGAARAYPDEPAPGPEPAGRDGTGRAGAGRAGAGRARRSRRGQYPAGAPEAEYPDEPTGVYRGGELTGGYQMPPGAEYQDDPLADGRGGYEGPPAGYSEEPPGGYREGPPAGYREEPPGGYREGPPAGYREEPPGSYHEEPPGGYREGPPVRYGEQLRGGYSEEPPGGYREETPGSYGGAPPGSYGEEPLGSYGQEPPGGYGEDPADGYPAGPLPGGDYLYPGESPARPYVTQPGGEPEAPADGGADGGADGSGRGRRRSRGRRPRGPAPESFPYGAPPDERQSSSGRYPDDI